MINISEKHDGGDTENNTIKLLTSLFDETMEADDKISKLEEDYGLPLTREIKNEVKGMCNYADSIENKALEKGLKALVNSLKGYISDFDTLYNEIIKNEDYAQVSKEQVKKYY